MAVTLSEKAATELKRVMEEQKIDEGSALRVKVSGGGCSGFSYQLGFDTQYDEKNDAKYACHGVDVIVDRKSALYLDGTEIEFHDGSGDIARRGFEFKNPNATKTCGCGSSFQA